MDPSLEEYIRLRVSNIINNIKESIERLSELWIYYQEFGGRDVEFLGISFNRFASLDYLETHHLAYANAVNNYELFLCFHNCGRNVEDHMTLFFSLMSYFGLFLLMCISYRRSFQL